MGVKSPFGDLFIKKKKNCCWFTGSVALSSVDPMTGTSQSPLRTVARSGRLVTGVAPNR